MKTNKINKPREHVGYGHFEKLVDYDKIVALNAGDHTLEKMREELKNIDNVQSKTLVIDNISNLTTLT